ncbi:hypothetical protein E2C01_093108 [Portunus trituberculatus]|uniref:Uncharacterized protein n=1 Tax=Portunus trituberculatus TaxID=210409 RepID=A0A5B7JX93_PORTR|nr:hypothetical protein [Portunus trituberculatus]
MATRQITSTIPDAFCVSSTPSRHLLHLSHPPMDVVASPPLLWPDLSYLRHPLPSYELLTACGTHFAALWIIHRPTRPLGFTLPCSVTCSLLCSVLLTSDTHTHSATLSASCCFFLFFYFGERVSQGQKKEDIEKQAHLSAATLHLVTVVPVLVKRKYFENKTFTKFF